MFRFGDSQSPQVLSARFADLSPPLQLDQKRVEAGRCLYWFDAPCTRACPTHIDVPKFIRQSLDCDEIGAAATLLEANILGGSCARLPHRGSLRRRLRRCLASEGSHRE
jgi:glutamate synthase (NADPH/NADH) small chain